MNTLRLMSLAVTKTELVGYAAGLPREQYLVACLRWQLDESVQAELTKTLASRSEERLSRLKTVPTTLCGGCGQPVTPERYRVLLAQLAVREMLAPQAIHTQTERANAFRVSRQVWQRNHTEPYKVVWGLLESWLGAAFHHIQAAQRAA